MNRTIATGLLLAIGAFAQEPQIKIIGPEGAPLPPGEHGNVMYQRFDGDGAGSKAASILSDVIMTRFAFDGRVVKGAPYSAEATTESTQVLADGNRITHKNTTMLYRDSQGRSRREENMSAVGPWSAGESFQTISITDPVGQVSYVLDPKTKTARKMPNLMSMSSAGGENVHIMVRAAHGADAAPGAGATTFSYRVGAPANENAKTEQLGKQTIDGLACDGTRTTITIPAGQMGNERPIDIVSERWYSPDLQVTVMTKHTDPRMGETTYKLNNINRAEPLPSLFQVPADYTLSTDTPKIRTVRKEKEL